MEQKKQIEFIKKIVVRFEAEGIRYCLLRNYEFLQGEPLPIESMDTLVAREDLPKIHQILLAEGFQKRKSQFSLKHQAYFKLDTFDQKLQKVSFDFQVGGIHWNDLPYLGEEVLAKKIKKDYFYVPANNDTFVMLLVHSILGKRYFKTKYQQILQKIEIDQKEVIKKLAKIFNRKIALNLFNLARTGQFHRMKCYPLIIYFLFKKPGRLISFTCLFFRWLKWKQFFAAYPLISLIGPDGAGKSTMAKKLAEFLRENDKKVAVIYAGRGKGQILPFRKIGNQYKKKEKKRDLQNIQKRQNNFLKNRKISFKRRLLYLTALPIYALDLLLRYWLQIMPKRRRRKVVITDRYCSDLFLMENVPLFIKQGILKLFPKPTLIFYLYQTPEVLRQRRPEETKEELERQLNLFEKMKKELKMREILSEDLEQDSLLLKKIVFAKMLREWY